MMKRRKIVVPPMPTFEELEEARRRFEEYEPRDLFYKAATELVALALDGKTKLSVAESLAVLLQTWNAMHYRFHPFDREHFDAIETVTSLYHPDLIAFRSRSIASFTPDDTIAIKELFGDFELVLGPVGAAKALHLWAPKFFPLWDRAIAKAYGIYLGSAGQNSDEYLQFMEVAASQVSHALSDRQCDEVLKRIDEYNYCRFTKGWLGSSEAVPGVGRPEPVAVLR